MLPITTTTTTIQPQPQQHILCSNDPYRCQSARYIKPSHSGHIVLHSTNYVWETPHYYGPVLCGASDAPTSSFCFLHVVVTDCRKL